MKKLSTCLLTVVLVCWYGTAFGWGLSGHDAICYIAENHLTPEAKKNVEKYLDGHSIVYYSVWMDRYRHTEAYKESSGWHTVEVSAEGEYLPRKRGDAVRCIEESIAKLKDYRNLDDSTVSVSIKFLIHLVGDMHCPSHVKFPWYKNYKFDLNGRVYEFHNFWDAPALDLNNRWGYIEYAHQLDRCPDRQREQIAEGTPREWLADNARDCRIIGEWMSADRVYSKDEARDLLNKVHPLAERQLLKAAYRLASVLNELFG
ncbi:S1/P1 nuclease [uncultured Alistipes sp.]|jgi:S1/P1 nuclease|uniref:S1/P1 nuclease n=1 Tax=uncultured Alistipes sp. TaxID=538949 RepID=UPI0025FFB15C|nr:S1/P1 nuclease [uncultured Alistipes sp.]